MGQRVFAEGGGRRRFLGAGLLVFGIAIIVAGGALYRMLSGFWSQG